MTTLLKLKRLTYHRISLNPIESVPTDETLAKAFLDYIYTSGTNQQKSVAGEVLNAIAHPVKQSHNAFPLIHESTMFHYGTQLTLLFTVKNTTNKEKLK